MNNNLLDLKTMIHENYDDLTQVEKAIADYFLAMPTEEDFSAKAVANRLYVSEASLSRFAKKLGFKGFREFIFAYTKNVVENKYLDDLTRYAIHKYQKILEETHSIVDNRQMVRIAGLLNEYKRLFVYGEGSSSLVAKEICYRFTRTGLDADACVDENEIGLNISRINAETLVIGISISGRTSDVIDGLRAAKEKGACTILLTSQRNIRFEAFCDEIVLMPYEKNITVSNIISPQFPPLVLMDIIYTHYINHDYEDKMNKLHDTLEQLRFTLEK